MTTVLPKETIYKDPSAELTYRFDWSDWLGDAAITTSTFTIAGPDAELTQDNAGLDATNQIAHVRLLGGTLGEKYTVTHRIVTDESPNQTDERSVFIKIRQQ